MSVDLSAFGWPEIGPPYDEALKDAVSYLLDRFDVLGVTACGTIIRGTQDVRSDLDIYVINSKPFRQRVQRFFNGVPAEFFINPLHQIRKYFSQERADSRPMTAHMIATGFVMYDPEGLFGELQAEAHPILSETPEPRPNVTQQRYDIALLYEDAMAESTIVAPKPCQVIQRTEFGFAKQRDSFDTSRDLAASVAISRGIINRFASRGCR
jgi:hypothetical protein